MLDTCRQLEREGYEVTYLDPDEQGLTTPAMVQAALREDTILVSVMHANNEIGVVNDSPALVRFAGRGSAIACRCRTGCGQGTPRHGDHEGRPVVDVGTQDVWPQRGRCALCAPQARVRLEAQMHGGGHERGMRSGTLATHQLVGFGEAARIAKAEMADEAERLSALRHRFWDAINDIPRSISTAIAISGYPERSTSALRLSRGSR